MKVFETLSQNTNVTSIWICLKRQYIYYLNCLINIYHFYYKNLYIEIIYTIIIQWNSCIIIRTVL
jgi:hypothetical protein